MKSSEKFRRLLYPTNYQNYKKLPCVHQETPLIMGPIVD